MTGACAGSKDGLAAALRVGLISGVVSAALGGLGSWMLSGRTGAKCDTGLQAASWQFVRPAEVSVFRASPSALTTASATVTATTNVTPSPPMSMTNASAACTSLHDGRDSTVIPAEVVSQLPSHITIVTFVSSGTYADEYRVPLEQRNCYAQVHGYTHIIDGTDYMRKGHDEVRSQEHRVHWNRIFGMISYMEAEEYMLNATGRGAFTAPAWWIMMDADIVIQHMAIKLESFIDNRADAPFDVVLSDHKSSDFNSGVVAVRNTARGRAFMRRWAAISSQCDGGNQFIGEQGGLNELLYVMAAEAVCRGVIRAAANANVPAPPCETHAGPCAQPPICNRNTYTTCMQQRFELPRDIPDAVFADARGAATDRVARTRAALTTAWRYTNRTLLHDDGVSFYYYPDQSSPLVDWNRFEFHDANFNPLATQNDFTAHSKSHQQLFQRVKRIIDEQQQRTDCLSMLEALR